MGNEIILASEFGLKEEQGKSVELSFSPKVAEKEQLTEIYNALIKKELSEELIKEASDLRKKLVKVRTGISKIHKVEKAVSLAYGRFVDALKNKHTLSVEQMETKLKEIENYYINIEKEKQEAKKIQRAEILELYEIFEVPENLGSMTDSAWYFYEKGIKEDFKQREAAKKKAEKERIAEEKAEKERIAKIEAENLHLQKEAEGKEAERLAELERIKEKLKIIKEKAEAERLKAEKLRKEAEAKVEAERKEIERKETEKQSLFQRGDVEKFEALKNDLIEMKTKYSFKSDLNIKKYKDVSILIDKIINHIK